MNPDSSASPPRPRPGPEVLHTAYAGGGSAWTSTPNAPRPTLEAKTFDDLTG